MIFDNLIRLRGDSARPGSKMGRRSAV